VFADFSCTLKMYDLDFTSTALPQDVTMKMQLLERNDGKKWFLWYAISRPGRSKINSKFYTFYNTADAIKAFENKFKKETDNQWASRDFFKAKASKYVLVTAEREKEQLNQAQQLEQDLFSILN